MIEILKSLKEQGLIKLKIDDVLYSGEIIYMEVPMKFSLILASGSLVLSVDNIFCENFGFPTYTVKQKLQVEVHIVEKTTVFQAITKTTLLVKLANEN